ncbi:MAG: hypothetical protein RLZZ543_2165 [Bacteroidota bacterium]|jgi:hypothetical protein
MSPRWGLRKANSILATEVCRPDGARKLTRFRQQKYVAPMGLGEANSIPATEACRPDGAGDSNAIPA